MIIDKTWLLHSSFRAEFRDSGTILIGRTWSTMSLGFSSMQMLAAQQLQDAAVDAFSTVVRMMAMSLTINLLALNSPSSGHSIPVPVSDCRGLKKKRSPVAAGRAGPATWGQLGVPVLLVTFWYSCRPCLLALWRWVQSSRTCWGFRWPSFGSSAASGRASCLTSSSGNLQSGHGLIHGRPSCWASCAACPCYLMTAGIFKFSGITLLMRRAHCRVPTGLEALKSSLRSGHGLSFHLLWPDRRS